MRKLTERLGAPVVMSRNGRGAFDDRHPLACTYFAARNLLHEADAVMAVGTQFIQATGDRVPLGPGARLITGFGWNTHELTTARHYDIPLAVVIFNDGAAGVEVPVGAMDVPLPVLQPAYRSTAH